MEYMDYYTQEEMLAFLNAATFASALFIDLPEMRSNSANKFFDALASGTPVFLNYGGWMHDLTIKHGLGLSMWQKSIEEVASELEIKMHDTEWLDEAGRKARLMAENYFSRDILADKLIKVLSLVVDGDAENVSSIAPGKYK